MVCDTLDDKDWFSLLAEELGMKWKYQKMAIPGLIQFQRRSNWHYQEDRQLWMSCAPVIQQESIHLIYKAGADFAQLACQTGLCAFYDLHREQLTGTVIWLVEGLCEYYKRIHRSQVSASTRALREDILGEKSRSRPAQDLPGKEAVDVALLALQFHTEACHVQLCKPNKVIEWLRAFSQSIALQTEKVAKKERLFNGSRVKCGQNMQDTFLKFLMEIPSVTQTKAQLIMACYPTLARLFWKLSPTDVHGAVDILTACSSPLYPNVSIGPAVARKVYQALLCRDPEQMALET